MNRAKRWQGNSKLRSCQHRLAVRLAAMVSGCLGLCSILASRAAAQSCAMCYQNAASSGAQGQAALRHGILILLVPALSLFGGIFGLIYYRRDPR